MNTITYKELASGLDAMYADRVDQVYKKTVMMYARTFDEKSVQEQVNNWSEAGCIEIIKPLSKCEDMDPCIRLLDWIMPRQ